MTEKISNKDTLYKQNKKILKEIVKTKKIKNFHGISIDTRSLKSGNLFLTIEGKNQDGIKYIPNAMKKGAQYIISSRSPKKFKMKTIKIKNEEKFLDNFASKKRDASDAKIIAITGSAGKTSLKDLIKDLLNIASSALGLIDNVLSKLSSAFENFFCCAWQTPK